MNTLSKLSNAELENSMDVHVRNERMSLDQIYAHINEVYRRELHLDSKYGSMKAYLIGRWKYSEREAYRKMDGARLLKDVPSLTSEIRNGNINADVIGEVSRAVKEKERATGEKISAAQKTELVKMVSGLSVSESQRELAQTLDIQVKEFESKRIQKDKSVRLEMSLSEEIYANLKLCQDHASHKLQQEKLPNTVESMIKILTDYYLKGHKLDENAQNKVARSAVIVQKVVDDGMQDPISANSGHHVNEESEFNSAQQSKAKINKTVTPKTRRMVFARDKCCQYKDPETGEICGETRFAQVDHKTPQWAGGGHELDNLQQLCANHNQRKYRKEAQLSWL